MRPPAHDLYAARQKFVSRGRISLLPAAMRKRPGDEKKVCNVVRGGSHGCARPGGAALAAPVGPQGVAPFTITDVTPDGGTTGFPTNGEPTIIFSRAVGIDTLFEAGNVVVKKVGARYQVIVKGGKDGVHATDGGKLAASTTRLPSSRTIG